MIIPQINQATLAKAKQVWKESIQQYGREITLKSANDQIVRTGIKAFCKRPKTLGLFDRTQASYDQEKYVVILDADDFPLGTDLPQKFMRAVWDDEEHLFLSVTEVDLMGVVFGYRILVKG